MKKECIVGEGEMLGLDSVPVMEAAKSGCLREMHACSFCSCPRQGLSHLPAAAAHFTHSLRECGRMASKSPLAEKNPHIVLQNAWAAEKTRGEGQLLNFFQQLEKLETRCTQ